MIPQAIASAGVYADLWTNLKSMDHALLRVQRAGSLRDIAPLDKARLLDLANFMKRQLEPQEALDLGSSNAFLAFNSSDHGYTLDADMRALLQDLPSFKEWLRSLSFKEKAARLAIAPEDYVKRLGSTLVPESPPKTEFAILRELLSKLLLDAETALVN